MDGTALYEAAAALFVARLAGIELDIASQIIVFAVAMLGAIGAPHSQRRHAVDGARPRIRRPPTAAIAILLPIDRILDTTRTMVNVEGIWSGR